MKEMPEEWFEINSYLKIGENGLVTIMSPNPEIGQNNLSGFLSPPDNIEEFSNSTQKLITDAKLRSKMGAFAKEDIRSKFELSDRISEFEEFLNN